MLYIYRLICTLTLIHIGGIIGDLRFNDIIEENKQYTTILDRCPLRIVGGKTAPISYVPYQVNLKRRDNEWYWNSFCGGSLITLNYVLTASHCFLNIPNTNDLNRYRIVAGTSRSYGRSGAEETKGQWKKPIEIYTHQHYHTKFHYNDIAVVQLQTALIASDSIRPIRMHTADLNLRLEENMQCIVSGYGHTQSGVSASMLQMVCVPLLTHDSCLNFYSTLYLTSTNFCAGRWGKDSCQGDSGGPIVCKGVLVGMVSYGAECGAAPGVYTRLSNFTTGEYIPFVRRSVKSQKNEYNYQYGGAIKYCGSISEIIVLSFLLVTLQDFFVPINC